MIVYLGSNELKKVYLGNTEIKKIYVGDHRVFPKERVPGPNTFLYYSFDNQNLNDSSGNWRNGTWYSWAWSFTTWILSYWANNGSRWIKIPSFIAWDFTLSFRLKPSNNGLGIQTMFWSVEWSNSYHYLHFHMYNSQYSQISLAISWDSGTFAASDGITWNARNHIVLTKSWSTYKVYKNKNLILTHTYSWDLEPSGNWLIGNWYKEDRHVTWVFDEVIIETVARTQEEINEYYNTIMGL